MENKICEECKSETKCNCNRKDTIETWLCFGIIAVFCAILWVISNV